MGVRGWRKIGKVTDAWKSILREARVQHGPQSQWRERKSVLGHKSSPTVLHKYYMYIPGVTVRMWKQVCNIWINIYTQGHA